MAKFYDGTKLLSMQDLNGNKPEIYIVTSNRSAGKTTYYGRYFVKRYINFDEKFMLLYRFNYELDDISDKFFKDIGHLFFKGFSMSDKRMASGIYHELFLTWPDSTDDNPHTTSCGYAVSMNSADQLKKYSHLFSDVQRILFDEFQSENNHYCSNEIHKFQSIHTTIARGSGSQSRYVPVFMLSNTVSVINPYYVALGIANRLQKNTKYLKGNGYVLEQGFNESAADALKQSAFMNAFTSSEYADYAAAGKYLNDSNEFIDRLPESGRYVCTIRYKEKEYSIKEYQHDGMLYVSDSYDDSYPFKIAVDLPDHKINYLLLSKNDALIINFKKLFDSGSVRFKNQLCKNAFIALISYKLL